MKTFLIWSLLGVFNGLITGFFFSALTWQFWAMTFAIFILLLIIEAVFFPGGF